MKFVNKEIKMRGFSLIELMIVMAIIAILAAVSIPLYGAYKERAIRAEAEQELMNVQTVEEDYFNSYRKYRAESGVADEIELENFYGINRGGQAGDHFKIEIDGNAAAYTATAYICYNPPAAGCDSGNKDMTCTITASDEKPICN